MGTYEARIIYKNLRMQIVEADTFEVLEMKVKNHMSYEEVTNIFIFKVEYIKDLKGETFKFERF